MSIETIERKIALSDSAYYFIQQGGLIETIRKKEKIYNFLLIFLSKMYIMVYDEKYEEGSIWRAVFPSTLRAG